MEVKDLFSSGNDGLVPQGDAARQAVDSLRGYAYQITAAALAWLDLDDSARLYLEVAEDYAVIAGDAMKAVQVKDTVTSGNITVNTDSVREAIESFVSLTDSNPEIDVHLHYFTTSEIGLERATADRPAGVAGLVYWRDAAIAADVGPLRSILKGPAFSAAVHKFVESRDDEALRHNMLRKVIWDCGKPDITLLRKELDERLVVVGRDVFSLPAAEALRVADTLIYRVLQKSVSREASDRFLTRASLYTAVDEATRMSVPRGTAELLNLISSGFASSALANISSPVAVTLAEPSWIVRSELLPSVARLVSRVALEAGVLARMRQFGLCIIIGASGLGKSSVARQVAETLTGGFATIDFRNANATETCSRLDIVFSHIGGLRESTFLFEDLNHLNEPAVALSLARVVKTLRRRDKAAIVTCYLAPTARALAGIDLDAACVMECPYFTEDEAATLVEIHGGDSKLWGRVAYIAGAFGHPQLVYAFISGMRARGWPQGELLEIVGNGLSTGDIEAERDAARRTLVAVLPETSRNLLYRLSLTIGRFDRAMALLIANVTPEISNAGESMDELVGPWLETVDRHHYRVSPLAARSGQEMISEAQRTTIHFAIATQFMAKGSINGTDVDVIITHALIGKNEAVLLTLANSIITSDERTREFLSDNVTAFKLLGATGPIYPHSSIVSGMLRLAQFKLLVTARENDKIAPCATALFSEAAAQPTPELRNMFKALAYGTVLSTMGIGNFLEDWLDLLEEFQELTEGSEILTGLRRNFNSRGRQTHDMFGALFAIGSAGVASVARLESIINRLDLLEPGRRSQYLSVLRWDVPDFSVFINSGWLVDRPRDAASAVDAANRYREMALTTSSWSIRPIVDQCWIARAIMLDEYGDDGEGALKVLDEAVAMLGDDVLLSRARAKIYWRAQDHARALSILREIAGKIGLGNSVERAFALREAAISAAKGGEWKLAESWFLESKVAAALSKLPDMKVMAVGLGADAAAAAIQTGNVKQGLEGLCEALNELRQIDPAESLRATYCHCVVRHVVLWAQAHIDNRTVYIGGAPITSEPGCCSNPDPLEAIRNHRIGPLDFAFYMLAQSEVTSGCDVGIADSLDSHLSGGRIPVMEVDLRIRRVTRDIDNSSAPEFARHISGFIEAIAYMSQYKRQIMASSDVFNPVRGNIPSILRSDFSVSPLPEIANDALLTFAIAATCKKSSRSLEELEAALRAEFGDELPGTIFPLAQSLQTPTGTVTSFDGALIGAARSFGKDAHQPPQVHCVAAIRFFQHAERSNFKNYLTPVIAAWQRLEWTRIVISETFRLSLPERTIPAVKAALAIATDDAQFLGALYLATSAAADVMLPAELKAKFMSLAAPSQGPDHLSPGL
ncbi:hypothetical protein [Dyella sp. 2YAF14]|uniref:hypothetical protein n=1 Tax=Dyella sp. 2YAF14 TaxID=3233025 RepID=UPI003F937C17